MDPEKIRRLYESDARGCLDEELLDEVAFALLARCESVITVTEIYRCGRLKCPGCAGSISLGSLGRGREALIRCPACPWKMTWGALRGSYAGRRLNGYGALDAFCTYVERFPHARTPAEKMRLIDRLIHAMHNELAKKPQRPVAVNLIEGDMRAVTALLEGLAYGEASTPGVGEGRSRWERIRKAQRG